MSILSQVQESCSPDEARLLDKVMEFLKREGLYSPQVKDMRTDDPVATDLIGALLTVNKKFKRQNHFNVAGKYFCFRKTKITR